MQNGVFPLVFAINASLSVHFYLSFSVTFRAEASAPLTLKYNINSIRFHYL